MSSRPRTPCRWSTSPAPTKCVLPCHTKTRSATRRARPTACSLFSKSLNENINAKTQRRRVATRFIFFASYHLCAFALKIMLNQFTISELTAKLATREVSAREATQACLDQIQRVDGKIHAFISHDAADALAQADAADKEISSGARKPLLGVPIAVKDVLAVKGQPLNCGSKILGKFISPYDATAVEKLKAAGAIVFGRCNMDEFAMGSSTENSAFGVTRNPWDTTRIPGGSSGGSAAAVAADECIASLGTDTGGSIRQPAALCGCVGMKPTYGRVSRYGLVAFASSLDQIGPFTKDIRDAATMLGVIGGHDLRDSTSVPQPVPDYVASLTGNIKGLKLGLPKEYMIGGLDLEVKAAVDAAVK